ncbi:Enoyl-CoA delta isomerase 2, mitochondrial [Gracilariopsis chorda]|uniref:Enoyl-CoA delta isomerase 2, mitochondrial n=1 Tax=Gracilariopsis chorda TaxID=448386 RepID=A0A2V3II56_9FLOR|nr:Enoyl-CoA delta isomerase 2, mitochondrial [Gracilariopsis chorda]|eukprot:PXF41752.1 Enoyl-CoA delta isomerase 2, mitochondrial [Gracilariopsis chorda]
MRAAPSNLLLEARYSNQVTQLTLNRPNRLNAFNESLYLATTDALERLSIDNDTRIILITGAGKTFCAGMDIIEASEKEQSLRTVTAARQFMQALTRCRKIVVAAVFGQVTGIGVTLLMHCDVVYCSESTTFQTPFCQVGIAPEFASSVLFPTMLGKQLSNEFLLRGEVISAYKMADAGICRIVEGSNGDVDKVFQTALQDCVRWSKEASDEQWASVLAAKKLMKMGVMGSVDSAIEREFKQIYEDLESGRTSRLVRARVRQLTSKL